MKAVIIIPARLASTRLPGKLLLEAGGKPILQHTFERASQSRLAGEVIIAAGDEEIAVRARGFGAPVVMTDPGHGSGSERVAEAARGVEADIVVNLQGDEPEIDPVHIDALIETQATFDAFASTLACAFPDDIAIDDPAAVKAVLGRRLAEGRTARNAYEVLYFTRALAPYPRDGAPLRENYALHIGIYAFRRDALSAFAAAPPGRLETIERLEQLRILEMGERMTATLVNSSAAGVDTKEDFAAFKARLLASGK